MQPPETLFHWPQIAEAILAIIGVLRYSHIRCVFYHNRYCFKTGIYNCLRPNTPPFNCKPAQKQSFLYQIHFARQRVDGAHPLRKLIIITPMVLNFGVVELLLYYCIRP